MRKLSLCLLLLTVTVLTGFAFDKTRNKKEKKETAATPAEIAAKALESQFKFQQGKITLADDLATLDVPPSFRYLDGPQAHKVLTELWGNPPSKANYLGMLFPTTGSLVGEGTWGVVITYEEDGYVEDKEAESINYNDLLKQMREGEQEANEERQKAGYEAVHLIGWAAPPHYDKAAHKLYWAKELQFGKEAEHTLNYDIRVLGRKGVLSLNAVASMEQLKEVEQGMQGVLQFVEFNTGSRYSDYKPGYDKLAAYGIGALIAGKVAAKVGLFKLLLGALLAGKKFVIVGLAALGALLKKLFSGRSQASDDPA